MRKSILSHIAGDFISEYENVANSSVAYLLNEYPTAREALKILLDKDEIPSYYITEFSSDDNGRPDITGLDENGNRAIIIEGKFWANLTDNQPTNYLKELANNGLLIFLAPEKRIQSLNIEIEKRLGVRSEQILVFSWMEFLKAIELENKRNYDEHLASDLIQITKLCQKMDTEGMPPLSQSDLDPMNGKIATHFADIIDECNPILRDWEHASFKGFQTRSKKYGHGFYFKGYNFGCYLCYDSHAWFTNDNHIPFWLYIYEEDMTGDKWHHSEKINRALKQFDPVNTNDEGYGFALKPGMDKNQVVKLIVENTKAVLDYLNKEVILKK